MNTYRNDKGTTIQTACDLAGGGWKLVSATKVEQNTRTEKTREKTTTKEKK